MNHDFFSPHHSVKIDLIVFANDTLLTKCMGYIYVLIVFNGYEFDIVERLLCFLKNVLNLISFILKQYSYHMCAFFLSFSSFTCFLNDHVVIRDFSKLFTLSLCVWGPLSASKPVNGEKIQKIQESTQLKLTQFWCPVMDLSWT